MFQERKIIQPLIDFVKTCPMLDEKSEVSPMAFNSEQAKMASNALAFTGTENISVDIDVLGNELHTEQLNFVLYIRRHVNDPKKRLEAGDFLSDFATWIKTENFKRANVPKFGDTEYEIMSASGGYWYSTTNNPDINDYMVQIHIIRQLEFQKEDLQ